MQNSVKLFYSDCENQIPSTCSVPSFLNSCEQLIENTNKSVCDWGWLPQFCSPTPGYVKDYCKQTCGTCGSKYQILNKSEVIPLPPI